METNQINPVSAAPIKRKIRGLVTWTSEEDDILREQIGKYGTENWTVIAAKLGDKTTRQCRRRWYTYLNSDFKRGVWTPEEDKMLCEAQKKYGNRWTEIAKVVPGRTDNAVKNRFNTLRKKRAKNQALAEESNTESINENNKRDISSSSELIGDVASSSKKPRPQFPRLQSSIGDKHLLTQNQDNLLQTLLGGNVKAEGTFLKKNDPKVLALKQQADLLSSLATKVKEENTEQSFDSAWKVLENFISKSMGNETLKCTMSEKDPQLDNLEDLMEELSSGEAEIEPSQRQPDMHDSPSSSEYSNGSIMSNNASEQMDQTQPEMCRLHVNAGSGLQTITENAENTTTDDKILTRESTDLEEISIPNVEPEIGEDVSALLLAELRSPVQITPLFKTFATTVPSPQFSESERHFLMKTLGIESPAPGKNNNPSQPPLCRRALIHSL